MSPVIDAHQHLWRYNGSEYGWMGEGTDVLRRDHLPQDLRPLLDAAGVQGTVAVQARRSDAETAWLLELAQAHGWILGVVGWLDVASPTLAADLERWADRPALVGMRELVHDMPDPGYAASPAHLAAVRELGPLGLVYDLLLRPRELPAALALVDACPDQAFVVDHLAKPAREAWAAQGAAHPGRLVWERGLRALAQRPNVACKLSGLLTESGPALHGLDALRPYLDTVLDAFGAARCMVGSDWPVCTLAASYGVTMGLAIDYAAELSATEAAALLEGTARRWYGLRPLEGEPG